MSKKEKISNQARAHSRKERLYPESINKFRIKVLKKYIEKKSNWRIDQVIH